MKTFVVILLGTLSTACGEALLSVGMKQVGDFSAGGATASAKALGMVTNPLVLLGMFFMAMFFVLYSAALSWADMSFAQPLTALTFVFGALIARCCLHERVSGWRWAGLAAIIIGAILISRDSVQLTTRR